MTRPEQSSADRPRPARGRRTRAAAALSSELPIARVAVDVPLAHLDRPFDYAVPEDLADDARPGVRVRVRFAGQLVDGYVLERVATTEHQGRLSRLERVVSPERVLTPEIAELARIVADRYAGTLVDVLRLAIPPRHAGAEAKPPGEALPDPEPPVDSGPLAAYEGGAGYVAALANGAPARAVWTALPDAGSDQGWPDAIAVAVHATLSAGRGALVVVPDARDLARVDAALLARLGEGRHALLTAELGPADRYRRWLAVRRGTIAAVAGTRGAMFAPVRDLGLVVLWDDGDDLHAEPRAPYPHAREVLALRAYATGAGALIGGYACTPEGARLVETGWARPLLAPRAVVRERAPLVRTLGDEVELSRDPAATAARLPSLAWRVARDALAKGPVLVQVPRRGYVPALSCERCRAPARCGACNGPLSLTSGHAMASCGWCGRPAGGWRCGECGGDRFRIRTAGARRTAEEIGRAFPSVPLRTSGRDGVIAGVGPQPALVVATPGAEPIAESGYTAALLLDGWTLLSRPDLRAGQETVRRWLNAAALVRSAAEGGVVVVLAEPTLGPVQAVVRWDPVGFARRELVEREQLGYPPAARVAVATAPREALRDLLDSLRLPEHAQLLGPVPEESPAGSGVGTGRVSGVAASRERAADGAGVEPGYRALIRAPVAEGAALADALRAAQGVRSAHKAAEHVRIRIDPIDLG
jgi:primosomal protein N' (replication factor Y)